ncbi:MAG TPA: 6-bladed beta-propeller [Albitalea sp.]
MLWALALAGCISAPPDPAATAPPPVFPPPPDAPRFIFERTLYTSADVIARDPSAALRRALTGETERGGEGMAKPYGVAVKRGRVYVADSVGASVKLFDIPGRRFDSVGQDELRMPLGLDLDDAGLLYVVDASHKLVRVYDAAGKPLRQFGGPKWLARPTGVGVDRQGERAYVVDAGGVDKREEHRVRVFSARTGEHLFDFGKRGGAPGEFNLARDAAVAPDGTVYVVDTGNFRIQAFDRDGVFRFSFGGVGRFPGQFARPREIAIDAQGNLYVSDAAFGNFQIFDASGKLLMHVGDRGERDAPARYMLPAGIAVDLDGRIYIADQFFRKVDVFRPAALKPGEGFAARIPASGN